MYPYFFHAYLTWNNVAILKKIQTLYIFLKSNSMYLYNYSVDAREVRDKMMKSKFQKILTSFVVWVGDGVFLHDLRRHEFDLVLGGWEGLGDLCDRGQGVHYRDVAQSLGNRQGCLSILQSNNIVSKSFFSWLNDILLKTRVNITW